MTLREIIEAARFNRPLRRQLNVFENVVFEMAQGPRQAPMPWTIGGLLVAALLFAGVTQLAVPSSVKVIAEPAGAEIVLDGTLVGKAPLRLTELSRGLHLMEVRQEGFESRTVQIEIAAFAPSQVKVQLDATKTMEARLAKGNDNKGVVHALFGKPTEQIFAPMQQDPAASKTARNQVFERAVKRQGKSPLKAKLAKLAPAKG